MAAQSGKKSRWVRPAPCIPRRIKVQHSWRIQEPTHEDICVVRDIQLLIEWNVGIVIDHVYRKIVITAARRDISQMIDDFVDIENLPKLSCAIQQGNADLIGFQRAQLWNAQAMGDVLLERTEEARLRAAGNERHVVVET